MSMTNSNDTIGNRIPDLPACNCHSVQGSYSQRHNLKTCVYVINATFTVKHAPKSELCHVQITNTVKSAYYDHFGTRAF